MVVELIIAAETEQDIAEVYAWYEGRRTGLGEEYLSCVDACIEAIRRSPGMHAVVHENYRRGLVRRFPFAAILSGPSPFQDWGCSTPRNCLVFRNVSSIDQRFP
ncbi:MAG: hypothetical protein WA705_17020 [Candidatus Ozemobacteraceae bacterium]